MFPESRSPSFSRQQIWFALIVTTSVLLGLAALWGWLGQIESLPLRFDGRAVGIGIAWGLAVVGISHGVYRIWPAYRAVAQTYMNLVIEPLTWADIVWIGVLPGIAEEILFRGVALAALGTTPAMILLTSIVFGLLHVLDLRFWPYGIWATIVGIAMAIGFVLTDNMLVPILAHMVTNILAGYSWKLQLRETRSR